MFYVLANVCVLCVWWFFLPLFLFFFFHHAFLHTPVILHHFFARPYFRRDSRDASPEHDPTSRRQRYLHGFFYSLRYLKLTFHFVNNYFSWNRTNSMQFEYPSYVDIDFEKSNLEVNDTVDCTESTPVVLRKSYRYIFF